MACLNSADCADSSAAATLRAQVAQADAAARAGKHVMVEKPLAVNGEHARRMAHLARANAIHLITNYETTWYASTYVAYRMAVEQLLGVLIHRMAQDAQKVRGRREVTEGLLSALL